MRESLDKELFLAINGINTNGNVYHTSSCGRIWHGHLVGGTDSERVTICLRTLQADGQPSRFTFSPHDDVVPLSLIPLVYLRGSLGSYLTSKVNPLFRSRLELYKA